MSSDNSANALTASLDLIDVDDYLQNGPDSAVCERLASCLKHYGAVLIHDSRVQPSDGDRFRSLMERYFAQPLVAKMPDVHPELHYQVGATPNGVERPRENTEFYNSLAPEHRPVSAADVAARKKDPKWRFFWRIGERPSREMTKFPQLNAPQVVPAAFQDDWASVMDSFGGKLQTTIVSVSEMLALGLGLPLDTFTEKLRQGPHLLAPTGTDLSLPELGAKVGATMAGYHYDLNFLTIHSAATFPGLHIWTRSGERLRVSCPRDALLVQAGAQLEHLTAGAIIRGFHEVVTTEATVTAASVARSAGTSTWRVSSTLFSHIRSDASLAPVGPFAAAPTAKRYDVLAGDQVAAELQAIALAER